MYSLLVADDEDLVRNAITTIIDWNSLGFSNIYQAEDGLSALDICRKYKIDLVLTDIVMPFMDGLQLSTALKEESPDTQIVILTGHEDFEYAKQSIDLGVKNYILKPVGAVTLYNKMKEICKQLNFETSQREYITNMKLQLYESLPVMREKFLYTLVCTEHGGSRSDIQQRLTSLELPLHSKCYAIGIIEMDLSSIDNLDIELFVFAAKNIAVNSVGDQHSVFDDNNNKIILIFNTGEYEGEEHYIAYHTMQVIQKAICSVLKIDVTCAIGSLVSELADLYHSFCEAMTALECKYSLGVNRVYDIGDLSYIEKSFIYPFDGIKDLINSIKFLSVENIESSINLIRKNLFESQNLSTPNIKMVFIEMITSMLKELSSLKEVPASLWNHGFSLYNQLENMISVEHILSKLLDFAVKVSEELHKTQTNSGRMIIDGAKKYIKKNYYDSQISLSSAASSLAVSTGYLSALFKKETNINFVEYLTEIRMEKARELLKTTDKRTYEIAFAVGFSNAHYFSVAFKKHCGMSPSDFRNTN